MTTFEQLAGKLETAAKNMKHAERQGVNAAAVAVRDAALVELAAETHGTLTLRGVGSKAKMGVQVKPSTAGSNYTSLVRGIPAGLWTWLTAGTHPHVVGAKRGTRRTGRFHRVANLAGRKISVSTTGATTDVRKVMAVPFAGGSGDFRTGPWVAGGSPAKHTFAKAVDKIEPRIPQIVDKEVSKVLRESFR